MGKYFLEFNIFMFTLRKIESFLSDSIRTQIPHSFLLRVREMHKSNFTGFSGTSLIAKCYPVWIQVLECNTSTNSSPDK